MSVSFGGAQSRREPCVAWSVETGAEPRSAVCMLTPALAARANRLPGRLRCCALGCSGVALWPRAMVWHGVARRLNPPAPSRCLAVVSCPHACHPPPRIAQHRLKPLGGAPRAYGVGGYGRPPGMPRVSCPLIPRVRNNAACCHPASPSLAQSSSDGRPNGVNALAALLLRFVS